MELRTFRERVAARIEAVNSCVCVGLDSDFEKLPRRFTARSFGKGVLEFNCFIVDATHQYALAFKLNAAFYESHGGAGMKALRETIRHCHDVAPEAIVILDYKTGDIGNSNIGYVAKAFDYYRADAVTVYPYFGQQAMQPFLDRADKGIIVLCRTSNPGAGEFQDLPIYPLLWTADLQSVFGNSMTMSLYEYVAFRISRYWNANGNCALVVGGTCPEESEKVREIALDMPLLIPGIGKQGGEVKDVVPLAQDSRGGGIIINSSRGIIFASNGVAFAKEARLKTIELRDEINQYRRSS